MLGVLIVESTTIKARVKNWFHAYQIGDHGMWRVNGVATIFGYWVCFNFLLISKIITSIVVRKRFK